MLIRQHIVLVFASIAIAVVIGMPTGILLTRYRSCEVSLGLATSCRPSRASPSLVSNSPPFIGGIGARTALVALVLYSLLPIIRNCCDRVRALNRALEKLRSLWG
jgi:osmoprotectant transport system permease protein